MPDSVTFAVGADPGRLAWAVDHARDCRKRAGLDPSTLRLGAFLNVLTHSDFDCARAMVRGSVGTFAHFSGMSRSSSQGLRAEDQAVVEKIGQTYDMSRHTRGDSGHAQLMTDAFIDRFAIAGTPDHCVRRFEPLLKLTLDHFVIVGPGADVPPSDMAQAAGLFRTEVLPALRSGQLSN